MDDPHRTPGDKDRSQLAARIRAAHDAGLIGEADRDIRLGNVRGAQSMLELDLMRRELEQVEASLSRMPAPVATQGWAPGTVPGWKPPPGGVASPDRWIPRSSGSSAWSSGWCSC